MTIRCLFGIHKMRKMPWMKTRDRSPRPDYACINCGKIKYDWHIYIASPSVGLGYNLGPQYEGQSPPDGYDSWNEYWDGIEKARKEILRSLRGEDLG